MSKKLFCNFPKTSSLIGDPTASCLQKFTIHFRRPAKIKQKNNAPYRGEYGFDWLRDEYAYPIEFVEMKEIFSPNRSWDFVKKYTPLCQQPYDLKKEYLKDVKNPIKPYNKDYYPAWLAIYACNIEGNANSPMHNKGVDLNLQLDEIDSIIDDGTEIVLKPGKSCLKVNPERIPISKFIAQGKKTRILDQYSKEEINYYEIENAVNVICQGGALDTHEEVKVFAKLGSTEIEVGKLMVYQNNIIPKLKVNLVSVVLEKDKNGNKIRPEYMSAINHLLNDKVLTQALIKSELSAVQEFDMFEFVNKLEVKDELQTFLRWIAEREKMAKEQIPHEKVNSEVDYIWKIVMDYYRKFQEVNASSKDINSYIYNEDSLTIFFIGLDPVTEFLSGGTYNYPYDKHNNDVTREEEKLYQAYCFYFKRAFSDAIAIKHELGHAMRLHHLFEKPKDEPSTSNNFLFYLGYTENIMDYGFKYIDKELPSNKLVQGYNQYDKKMDSFYKWQWDKMRKSSMLKY